VDGGPTRIEYAGLARGEDPTLDRAVSDLAARHGQHLDGLPESSDDAATPRT
jgi:cytochrome c biogenesis protein